MKTILSFLFLGAIIQTQALASGLTPECTEWRGKLLEVLDRDAMTEKNPLPIKKGHSVSELSLLAETYPGEPSFPFRDGDLPKDPNPEQLESTVNKFLDHKTCSPLLHYEIQKGLLTDKSVTKTKKLKLIGNLLKGARNSTTKQSSIIDLLLDLNLFWIAQDQGILKLSDALYLELGSITILAKKNHSQLTKESPIPECESPGKQKCSKEQMRAVYEVVRKELSESKWIGERVSWWAERVR
jgi:hypothetical protein